MLIAVDAFALECNQIKQDYSKLDAMALQSDIHQCESSQPQAKPVQAEQMLWHEEENTGNSQLWDGWVEKKDDGDMPLVKQDSEMAFYGLSMWLPEKHQDQQIESIDDAKEWLLDHGLKMTLGVSSGEGSMPRFRVDYRWHPNEESDIILQLQIPLN